MFVSRILIWLSWLLRAHIAYVIDTVKIIAAFCRISYCVLDLIRLNSIVCHVQTAICTMMWFSMIDSDINWLMFEVCILIWNSCIDMAISTSSLSYCIWNRYHQNHRSILPNLLLFAWFDTVEFNRMLCSNNKKNNDAVFSDRFRYQLAMFRFRVLIRLSQLLDAHIAYEIDTAKIIAAFFQISYWLHDLIRLEFNRLPCSKSKMYDDVVFDDWFRYQLTMFEVCTLLGLSGLLYNSYCIWDSYIKNNHL